jgi:putative Mg2+ transporter-C (MgtC) family protein
MSPLVTLCRLLVAALLGGLIGLDRSRSDKAAGVRTHMLVSVGSCLVMIVSAYGFSDVIDERRIVLDPSRVAAQVVSGIGFLGAGMILRKSETVLGLTTAASTWTVAAIGLAAGAGLYVAAAGGTGMILLILTAVKRVEERITAEPSRRRLSLNATSDGFDTAEIPRLLEGTGMELRGLRVSRGEDAGVRIEMELGQATDEALLLLVGRLQAKPGVREVVYEESRHG